MREEMPGGLFHVYARGNNRRRIYLDDEDRLDYLKLLGDTVRHTGWNCMSYCLMDNHVHLLVETPEPNLGIGIQRLHGRYGRRFNDRYGTTGHLFGSRFGSVRVKDDGQLSSVLRYIALNPVEAGISRRPEEFKWSSYAAMLASELPPFVSVERLFWYLGGLGGNPRAGYVRLVEDALWV